MSFNCAKCGLQSDEFSSQPASCPSCGASLAAASTFLNGKSTEGLDPLRGYFVRVWKILTQPVAFFKSMPVTGGVSGPLAFALITHWIGSAIGYLWNMLIGGAIGSQLDQLLHMAGDVAEVDNPGRHSQMVAMSENVKHWIWGAGSVIADPFLTLAQILFVSFLVFLGARIFVSPSPAPAEAPDAGAVRPVTFESALRIVCYGMTPAILTALPLFGGAIAYFYKVFVTIVAAREVYRIGNTRASLVALFPHVLLMGVLLLGFFAFAVAMLKFFTMTF